MKVESLKSDIYTYIKREMNNSNDFDLSANIIEEGMVDSMAILTLVSFLEDRYRVEIDFQDVNAENFAKVETIASYIQNLADSSAPS